MLFQFCCFFPVFLMFSGVFDGFSKCFDCFWCFFLEFVDGLFQGCSILRVLDVVVLGFSMVLRCTLVDCMVLHRSCSSRRVKICLGH